MDTFVEDARERWRLQKRKQRRRRAEDTAHVVISNQEEEDDSPITASDIRKRQKKRDAQRRYRAKKAAQQAHVNLYGWQDMASKPADDLFVEDDGRVYFNAGAEKEDVYFSSGAMSDEGQSEGESEGEGEGEGKGEGEGQGAMRRGQGKVRCCRATEAFALCTPAICGISL